METYVEYKVWMIKEKGDASNVCQSYDQYSANHDKEKLRGDTYVLRSWIPTTGFVLNDCCLVNVSFHAVKKVTRESWIYSFKKVNFHPKQRVSFSQWCDHIKPVI